MALMHEKITPSQEEGALCAEEILFYPGEIVPEPGEIALRPEEIILCMEEMIPEPEEIVLDTEEIAPGPKEMTLWQEFYLPFDNFTISQFDFPRAPNFLRAPCINQTQRDKISRKTL